MTDPTRPGDGQLVDFGGPEAARRAGMREAAGMAALALGASYLGFGAFARQSGWGLAESAVSATTSWALPGQVALVEVYAMGGSLLAAIAAVAFANARLLPMVATLLPLLRGERRGGKPDWRAFLAAHFIAITGWAIGMQRFPTMRPEQRLPFFWGFCAVLFLATIGCTALGFVISGFLPRWVTLGLVFLTPLYFMLIFAADLARPARAPALLAGAVLGPLLHLLTPDWGLLATGLIGGSLAFALGERRRRRR